MPTILISAIISVSLGLSLPSGPMVEISYTKNDITDTEASRVGLEIAKSVWEDFCRAAKSADHSCGSGSLYQIEVSVHKMPQACDAVIKPRVSQIGALRRLENLQAITYSCYFHPNDSGYHLYRDDSTELPPLVHQ